MNIGPKDYISERRTDSKQSSSQYPQTNCKQQQKREKYDTLFDSYFNKELDSHKPKDRVEDKIRQFQQLINVSYN